MFGSKKKKTGPARMKELGKVPVTIWLTAEQAEQLDETRGRIPRATYVLYSLGQRILGVRQFRNHA